MQSLIFFAGQLTFLPSYLYTTSKILKKRLRGLCLIRFLALSPLAAYFYAVILLGLAIEILPAGIRSFLTSGTDFAVLLVSVVLMILYGVATGRRREACFLYSCLYLISMPFTATYDNFLVAVLINFAAPVGINIAYVRLICNPFLKIVGETEDIGNRFLVILPLTAELMFVLRLMLFVFLVGHEDLDRYDLEITVFSGCYALLVLGFIFISVQLILQCMRDSAGYKKLSLRMKDMSIETAFCLAKAIDARDPYTNGHSERVAKYSKMIAARLGKNEEYQENIYYIAILHDVGKIGVPDSILRKPGRLTKEEYETIKEHTTKGYHILEKVDGIEHLADGALYHHERWDGKGYPQGISKTEIPEVSRIIAVADAYDAMTSNRTYRSVMEQEAVYQQIEQGKGTQFWPEAADIMLDIIRNDTEYHLHQ